MNSVVTDSHTTARSLARKKHMMGGSCHHRSLALSHSIRIEWVPSYAASVHDIVLKHGGKYLSRSGNVKTLEGNIAVRYDHEAWLTDFDRAWPAGSPASLSYRKRIASGPAYAWPAIAGRDRGLDVVNCGYAGSARGETVSAEHLAAVPADVISITHGTNCWTRIPHSAAQMRANTEAFVRVVRAGHEGVPIVVASPVQRPDAEGTPNKLGATLVDLRAAMEDAVRALIDDGDTLLTLVPGADILDPALLADGVHPGDEGHAVLAKAFGAAVVRAYEARQAM